MVHFGLMKKTIRILMAAIPLFCGSARAATEYDRALERMTRLELAHPSTVARFELGANDQGTAIQGLRIGHADAAGPALLVVGVHHGNERLSGELALAFAERVASLIDDASDEFHGTLANRVFHVVPVLNIGGYNANRRTEINSRSQTVDPNRDYPDPCADKPDFLLESTRALARYVEDSSIVGAVTLHGYIGTFTHPFGYYTDNMRTLDHLVFDSVTHEAARRNGYRVGTHGDVVYPAAGTFEDWAYLEHGVWVNLLELASQPDIGHDTDALLAYFSLLPTARSTQHGATGHCTESLEEILGSRP